MQRVYHRIVKDVDELRERLISVWCELDQSVVNHAIDEWRRRLLACVDSVTLQWTIWTISSVILILSIIVITRPLRT